MASPLETDPPADAPRGVEGVEPEALLKRLLPRIRNLCRFLVRGDGDVDDVAQLSCIEILKSLPTWRGDAPIEIWALRITGRTARRYTARRRDRRAKHERMAPELRAVPPRGEPDKYVERRRLADWLDLLPEEQREAVVLHHVLEMTVPEVAEELAVPRETVRSRLRLGMKRLRALHARGSASRGAP